LHWFVGQDGALVHRSIASDAELASASQSGQRLLVKAALHGKQYQADPLSLHRVVRKTMLAAAPQAGNALTVDLDRQASEFRLSLQERAKQHHQKRLKRTGRFVSARVTQAIGQVGAS